MQTKQQVRATLPITDGSGLLDRRLALERTLEEKIAHLLRRAGFGASPEEVAAYASLGYVGAVDRLVYYEQVPDVVDSWIGQPGYVPVVADNQRATYAPNYWLDDARVRWLFRMLYSPRPLQEKMALFWHNHFATGWSKIAGDTGSHYDAVRLMAAVPSQDVWQQLGQIELFRSMALGNFYDLLVAVTRDPAMLYWLDGRLNSKTAPQENYGREVMELFTMGVTNPAGNPNYTEDDVKAAARVFTGWRVSRFDPATVSVKGADQRLWQFSFYYDPSWHDSGAKEFTFPIYPDGTKVIPPRAASQGMQDGLDFLAALVRHPSTAYRLATKLYQFFVNDVAPPSSAVNTIAGWLRDSGFNMRVVMRQLFLSDFFLEEASFGARYRWPVEHVIGTLKALGPGTRPLSNHLTYLTQMNELLFDPPSVEGYKAGPTWINSTTMLARANFVQSILENRQADLVNAVSRLPLEARISPAAVVDYCLWRLGITRPDPVVWEELVRYLTSGTSAHWTGSLTQLRAKIPGLIHLISGTADYAFV